ncbi:MAG: cupin domain-containing protein [Anaerolineae bacterium]|nr:cupin domain-containing protein [Anaerolineae bacterium]
MRPYALNAGDGWTYRYDINFTVKAGELNPGRGASVIEYTTRKGEEPPDHTHSTEDEIFYILKGDLTFRCDGESFEVGVGGFMYLPQGIEHGYTIRSEGDVQLLVITFPTRETADQGWDGFVADIEAQGELLNKPS